MPRPAEIAQQTGTDADFESYVRANFPQCIQRDENGDELVPVQYWSAYSHEVGVHYIDRLLLQAGTYDDDGNEITPPVYGGQSLMPDWHVEPEQTDQADRIEARIQLKVVIALLDTGTPARIGLERALPVLNNIAPGVTYTAPTPPTITWAGPPRELPADAGIVALAKRPGAPEEYVTAVKILKELRKESRADRWPARHVQRVGEALTVLGQMGLDDGS
jgi:hypothetical protein